MFPIKLSEGVELRLIEMHNTQVMFDLIEQNRGHLDQWLRWSGRIRTLEDARGLAQRFVDKFGANDGFHAGIWVEGALAGGLMCHYVNHESKKSEIGYWLGADYVGRGLATAASRAVIGYLFEDVGLNRIEIQSGVDNVASRAIPERLGFTLEGIKRQSEWITTRFVDHAIYSLLAEEWVSV
jgi:ribosomal-protein-serine acetyltransferase